MTFNPDVLKINPEKEAEKISQFINNQVKNVYRRHGIIVGLSGGVDSAVMASLAVEALGKNQVVGLLLPEKESNPISLEYAANHAETLGIESRKIDITPTVDSICGYAWRDDYLKSIVPEYSPDCAYNITLPADLLERDAYNIYTLQVRLPDGSIVRKRLNQEAFRAITGFASIKIRARMIHLYWEAERRSLVVAGTTNRTEMILGDFCKYGDGGTDTEALAHLYKNQIFQLARYLEVAAEIIERPPSPDTFSLPVNDQEFFFRIPFEKLDLLLHAWEHKIPVSETAAVLMLAEESVKRAFRDFTAKNRATAHLRELAYTLK